MLIRSGPSGISTLMRRLLTGYAVSFNRRHKRHGQLFQNRYKSIICQEDTYFVELVRYIHLNPLRAKIVKDLNELGRHAYSGHSVLMGKRKRNWQDVEYVLGYFEKSRRNYRTYVKKGISIGRRPELVGGGLIRSMGGWDEIKKVRLTGQDRIKSDQRILGGSDFVLEVLSESAENFTQRYEYKRRGFDFEKVLERVSSLLKLEKEYITGRGRQRKRVQARDLLCYWCSVKLGISMANLAKRLKLTLGAVSHAVRRGENVAKEGDFSLED
jgi:hypothetical protein